MMSLSSLNFPSFLLFFFFFLFNLVAFYYSVFHLTDLFFCFLSNYLFLCNLSYWVFHLWLVMYIYFKILFFLFMRDRESDRDTGRGRSRLPMGAWCRTRSQDPRMMTWAKGRCSTTEPPWHSCIGKISKCKNIAVNKISPCYHRCVCVCVYKGRREWIWKEAEWQKLNKYKNK